MSRGAVRRNRDLIKAKGKRVLQIRLRRAVKRDGRKISTPVATRKNRGFSQPLNVGAF